MSSEQIGSVYGVILNDHGSLAALGSSLHEAPYKASPKAPVMYVKPRNTHVPYGAVITVPDGVDTLEIGATLGVVFDRATARCSLENALDGVRGYRVVADLSIPHSSFFRPAIREKCFDDSCVLGALIPRDALNNPDMLEVETFVNGTLEHSWTLETLIRSVRQLIVDVSEFITLNANDVLLVGVPIGAARAKRGDVFAVEIPGMSRLEAKLESRIEARA